MLRKYAALRHLFCVKTALSPFENFLDVSRSFNFVISRNWATCHKLIYHCPELRQFLRALFNMRPRVLVCGYFGVLLFREDSCRDFESSTNFHINSFVAVASKCVFKHALRFACRFIIIINFFKSWLMNTIAIINKVTEANITFSN